uniref:Uncharacterized protein n=1 Tax=Tanacetum cinerariifolium TaxID=118510 RepID=A0A6L2K7Z7_TANCI|nr:hypothetical protein [Tanacetum cinerariifolium]
MTGNISYLFEYEPYDGGYVSFGQGGGKITGKGIIKTGKLEFENVYFVKELKYNLFIMSQICDNKNSILLTDSKCIVLGKDFKLKDDTNVLLRTPRQHNMYLIDLNNIVPHKNLTCLVAKASVDERKQHKASCKTKLVNSVSKPLHTLHMDLFGATSISSLNHKWYCLVVTDDFFRREFGNARTLQQNEVAKRRNRTLIEAARTMLADAKLPVTFWAEAVNTAYHLGKFDAKGDKGYFVGYSRSSKAFKVFNKRTKKVEENLYVDFLENKLIEKGAGPNWIFDIDTLTNFMNYVPVVVAGTSSTNISVESAILTVSSPVPTVCLANSSESSSGPRLITKEDFSQKETPSLGNTLTLSNRFEDTFGMEADLSNMETSIPASPTPTFRIQRDHPKSQIIGPVDTHPPRFQDPEFPDIVYKVEKAMGTIDQTLFIRKHKGEFLLVQVYVRSLNPHLCREFEALMHDKFQMSAMGELTFFLGLQVLQKKDGIFLSQDKYVGDILKKFGYSDIRHHVTPKECHLYVVKEIFRYLKDRKSTTGGCQILGRRLISWQCKKQTIMATSTTKAEYVAAASGCGKVLWIQNQLLDYGQYTRRAKRIAQSKALSPATDETASLSRDDRQREAFLTVSSLDMTAKIKDQNLEISRLKARVKSLEDKEKRSAEPTQEDAQITRGIMKIWEELGAFKSTELGSNDTKEMVNVLSSMEAANILTSKVAAASVSFAAGVSAAGVPTVSGSFPTVSAIFTTASVVTPYTRRPRGITIRGVQHMRSPTIEAKDKGKQKVVESKVPKKRKLQEQIHAQVAREMEEEFARENHRSKPLSKKEQREFYMSVLRSHAGWKTKHFRRMTLEQLKEKFTPTSKSVSEDVSVEELKGMMQLVPLEEVYVEALQVKQPIIDWEIHSEGKREYWKIIRLADHTTLYQFFVDMLKQFDREDLHQLWTLVKETFSIRKATKDKEKKLWVELKRLFEPDFEDQLWTHNQAFMHDPLDWKLYDTCGVHHVSTKYQEIFMLVEKDYPLRRGITTLMIFQDEKLIEASSPGIPTASHDVPLLVHFATVSAKEFLQLDC